MAKLRKRVKGYTVVPNSIMSHGLSLKALGLFLYIIQKPDGWDFSVSGVAAQMRDGKDSIRTAIKELEDARLLVRSQKRSSGIYGSSDWIISDEPMAENPTTVLPVAENQTQVITKKVITKKDINLKINTAELGIKKVFGDKKKTKQRDSVVDFICKEYVRVKGHPPTDRPKQRNFAKHLRTAIEKVLKNMGEDASDLRLNISVRKYFDWLEDYEPFEKITTMAKVYHTFPVFIAENDPELSKKIYGGN